MLYISSPRIFGDSFFNNKDIIFLSLVTIVFYYKFKLIDHFNYTNIIYFAFFSGLACSLRIVAIFIPFSFLVLILFSILNRRHVLFYLKRTFIFLLIFLMSLYLFWPYLWESPIKNLLYAVKIFSKYSLEIKMLFNGNYIS